MSSQNFETMKNDFDAQSPEVRSPPSVLSIASDSDDEKVNTSVQHRGGRPYDPLYNPFVVPSLNSTISRAFDRSQRAMCRVLVKRYQIPPSAIQRHCLWSLTSISKAVKNTYAPKDKDVHNDQSLLPPTFDTTLGKIIAQKKSEGGRRTRSRSEKDKKQENAKRTVAAAPRAISPSLSAPDKTNMSSSASNTPRAESQIPREDFIRDFVASVPLKPTWHRILENNGFTEESLRRIAGIPKREVDDAIARAFPEMLVADRILFVTAVAQLSIVL
ncbi:hypothetical protein FB451DRAFT_1394917 [Mycena latifolia]|nr:hypothetical protein FB451DRAFT_1394917 [Mycena latifolia]